MAPLAAALTGVLSIRVVSTMRFITPGESGSGCLPWTMGVPQPRMKFVHGS